MGKESAETLRIAERLEIALLGWISMGLEFLFLEFTQGRLSKGRLRALKRLSILLSNFKSVEPATWYLPP